MRMSLMPRDKVLERPFFSEEIQTRGRNHCLMFMFEKTERVIIGKNREGNDNHTIFASLTHILP